MKNIYKANLSVLKTCSNSKLALVKTKKYGNLMGVKKRNL